MNIVDSRKIFYIFSSALFLASVVLVIVFGLRIGIDFTGGSFLEAEFRDARPPVEDIAKRIAPLNLGEARLQPAGERGLIIRLRHIDEPSHQLLLSSLGPDASEKRFDTVGPTIGRELRTKSITAVALVILLIVSYIAFAFRKVSEPVQSWKYGVATIVALVHDVVIPTGLFALAGRFLGFEVDTLFVTAILTILGFSVHDTIVVFDRIRENLKKSHNQRDFAALVNRSVNETFARSVNTSLTVILALAAVWFFGGESTRAFSATLIVGIIAGTYSSIFIASPLLVTWQQWDAKSRVQNSK